MFSLLVTASNAPATMLLLFVTSTAALVWILDHATPLRLVVSLVRKSDGAPNS